MLDNFWHLFINEINKLLQKQDNEQITKIAILVFLVIRIHIRPIKLLENIAYTILCDLNKRFLGESESVDWGKNITVNEILTTIDKELFKDKNL